MKPIKLIHTFVILCISLNCYCHGDLHERIQKVTSEIESFPDSSSLYLKRGKLLYQHEKYAESIIDLEQCTKLEYDSYHLDLAYAKVYLKLKQPKKAIKYLDHTLDNDSQNVLALKWKGKALMELNKFSLAAEYFEAVIKHVSKTLTENYIEAAFAWEQVKSEQGIRNATLILEKGIQDLGELIILYNKLVNLHVNTGNFQQGIIYQTKIINLSIRKERPYYQRALIYLKDGNSEAALKDLEKSKLEIDKLPQRIKINNATKALIENIKKEKNNLTKL